MAPRDIFFDFLVQGPGDLSALPPDQRRLLEEHARSCAECAWLAARIVGEIAGLMRGEEGPPEVTPGQVARVKRILAERGVVAAAPRGPLLRMAGWARRRVPPAAAAAVLLLAGLAAGGAIAFSLRRPLVTFGTMDGKDQVSLHESLGFPFESLDIPGTASVEAAMLFEDRPGRPGRLFAVSGRGVSGLELAAFGEDQVPIWAGRTAWGEGVVREFGPEAEFQGWKMVRVPGRREAPEPLVERVALLTTAGTDSILTLLAPRSGAVDFQFRFPGCFTDVDRNLSTLQVLPAEPGSGRPLVLGGRRGEGLSAVPVLLLLSPDGTTRQEVELPLARPGFEFDPHVSVVTVDHRGDPVSVTAQTFEGVHFRFEMKAGRLDTAGVVVRKVDNFLERIRVKEREAEAKAFLDAEGGEEALTARLRAGVVDVPEAEFHGGTRR